MTKTAEKINTIRNLQKSVFVRRDDEIDAIWYTLLAGEHGVLFGPPGVAKTMAVEDTTRYIKGYSFFSKLMSKLVPPEDLFGPISLTQLKQDKYVHQIDGYLPTADIAFLDEGFKSGATILNTLLKIMNEREFRNGTDTLRVPLKSMFIASNELPTEAELSALHDRILFRLNVTDLASNKDFRHLLENEQRINAYLEASPTITIDAADLAVAMEEVKQVEVPSEIYDSVVDIRYTLQQKHGITVSSRRWMKSLKGVRAHAYLSGRTTATTHDLSALSHMLWDRTEQIPVVEQTVWRISNPGKYTIREFRDKITELMSDMEAALPATNQHTRQNVVVEYSTKWTELAADIHAFINQMGAVADQYSDKTDYMLEVIKSSKKRLAIALGEVPEGALTQKLVEWQPETI